MTKFDIALLWTMSAAGALAAVVGKLGMALFLLAQDPPVDPVALVQWQRRRRWLIYSELSALPLFATIGVSATVYFNLLPVVSVLISMALGALGFGFLLHALQMIVRRKLEIRE